MPTIPLQISGPSSESRAPEQNAQATRNLYPEPQRNGLSSFSLMSWPGAKLFSTGSSPNRGILGESWMGCIFVVNGTNLFKIDSAGTRTNIGAIPGTGRCVMTAAAAFIYIVTDGLVFRSNGSSVEAVTDADLETPNSVAFLNSQLIYDGDGGRFTTSTPGDGSDIDGLNYATAESKPDDLIRVYAFNQVVYMMGTTSGEPWYNSGVGNPPFDRIDGGIFNVGLAGVYAITNTDRALYFLGNDRTVYRLEGYTPVPVSSLNVGNAIEGYSTVDDCFAYSLRLQGQSWVVFTFPTANKTWIYSESVNEWVELVSGVDDGRHIANGYCYAFGKHLITDYRNGNVYEWDLNTYTDNGEAIIRERITQPFHGDDVGAPDKEIIWHSIRLVVNSGSGLVTGQGSNPKILMSFSEDGVNWSDEITAEAGPLGRRQWQVEWFNLGMAKTRMFRFRMSDPIEWHLFKLYAEVEATL